MDRDDPAAELARAVSGRPPGGPTFGADGAATLLGEDLWALAGARGRLVEAALLTTLPSARSSRASFRLRLADGRVFKGCRFEAAPEAARFAALLPLLDRRRFPGLVATQGAAALVEWAEGVPLVAVRGSVTLMEEMGAVQGSLHRVTLAAGHRRDGPDTRDWPHRLARYLDELVSLGAIDRATQGRAQALVRPAIPDELPAGLVHKDFCLENMVVSPAGVVRVVDNETLAVDCPDYDLARTWYRWPMAWPEAEAYLSGYRAHRSTTTLERHFPFWAVAVLAESALFRLQRGLGAEAALPLERLTELLAAHEGTGRRPAFVGRGGSGPGEDPPR